MVSSCCVVGCTNRFRKGGDIRLFRVPRGKRQRRAWVKAINRKDFVPNEHTRVCSAHFVSGWPDYVDPNDVDFAPSVFLYKQKPLTPAQQKRRERSQMRSLFKTFDEAADVQKKFVDEQLNQSLQFHDYFKPMPMLESTQEGTFNPKVEIGEMHPDANHHGLTRSIGTMTEKLSSELEALKQENQLLKQKVEQLRDELKQKVWSKDKNKQ